jgi:hypothetical protein
MLDSNYKYGDCDWLGEPTDTDKNGIGKKNGIDYGPELANKSLLLWNDYLVTALSSPTPIYIGDYKEYNNYYYAVKSDQTVKLVGANWDELKALGTEKLELPSEIDGMTVNEVDVKSFGSAITYLPTIKEIVVPDSITIIRAYAFAEAFGVRCFEENGAKINLPGNVEYLGHGSYYGLGFALGEQVVLPETLEFIDYFAFGDTFTGIVLPESNFVNQSGEMWCYSPRGEGFYNEYGHIVYSSARKIMLLGDNCISQKSVLKDAQYPQQGVQPVELLMGDIDENGEVNVLDGVMLARLVVNDTELELSDAGKANADLNGDGVVTHDDLTLLLKTLAKQ